MVSGSISHCRVHMSACSSWRIYTRHCLYIARRVRILDNDDCRRNTDLALFSSTHNSHTVVYTSGNNRFLIFLYLNSQFIIIIVIIYYKRNRQTVVKNRENAKHNQHPIGCEA